MARYLDRPDQWSALAAAIRKAGIAGIDSETVGHDPRETSPHTRAEIVYWSIALRSSTLSPRGYYRAVGYTLPAAAMHHPELKAVLEDPLILLIAHNATYDEHAFRNAGVVLRGVLNTLSLVRLVCPGRKSVGLKGLMVDHLGRVPTGAFKELFSRPKVVERVKLKKHRVKLCSCGVDGCRKRKDHIKVEHTWEEEVREMVNAGTELIDLREIVPGHPLFELLVKYAAEDAEAALEEHDWCHLQKSPGVTELPW